MKLQVVPLLLMKHFSKMPAMAAVLVELEAVGKVDMSDTRASNLGLMLRISWLNQP